VIGRLAFGLLCFVLGVWAPLGYARELVETLPSLDMRGTLAFVELLIHGVIAAVSVAAAWSLLSWRAHGPALARVALIGLAAVSVQSLYWSVVPRQTPPGTELPLAALAIVHAAAWLVFLQRSSRARDMASDRSRVAVRLYR
jgi:hypothetical protein